MRSTYFVSLLKMVTIVVALVIATVPASAAAAPIRQADIKQAQTIMKKFGIPGGQPDGISGPQTSRGLCAFRFMAGLPVNRNNLDSTTLSYLRSYNDKYSTVKAIPARKTTITRGANTYVLVNKTCQAMYYVQNLKYQRVMATSTGNPAHAKAVETKNGVYSLQDTKKGWDCSTQSPDSCREHPGLGEFAYGAGNTYGNMYNKRHVYNGVFVHGSTYVPTFPDSHGCIRVTPADSDWMYHNVGNSANPPIIIAGAYKW